MEALLDFFRITWTNDAIKHPSDLAQGYPASKDTPQ